MSNTQPAPAPKHLWTIYNLLDAYYGDLHWWPAESKWEVIVGAILTQNTAWVNVEKGIANLRAAGLLESPQNLHKAELEFIEQQIKPCGYYRQKALKLKAFTSFLEEQGGWKAFLARASFVSLRADLLSIWGIGKETADSILLYALDIPVFVIDAYTKRILMRHGLCNERASYDELQDYFHTTLADEGDCYKQFHALLVNVGKDFCKKSQPHCGECPLARLGTFVGVEQTPPSAKREN